MCNKHNVALRTLVESMHNKRYIVWIKTKIIARTIGKHTFGKCENEQKKKHYPLSGKQKCYLAQSTLVVDIT